VRYFAEHPNYHSYVDCVAFVTASGAANSKMRAAVFRAYTDLPTTTKYTSYTKYAKQPSATVSQYTGKPTTTRATKTGAQKTTLSKYQETATTAYTETPTTTFADESYDTETYANGEDYSGLSDGDAYVPVYVPYYPIPIPDYGQSIVDAASRSSS
jgi:hypothetical protein